MKYYIVIAQDKGMSNGYNYHNVFSTRAAAETFADQLLTIADRVNYCHVVAVERLLPGEIATNHPVLGLGFCGIRKRLLGNLHVGATALRAFCARHVNAREMYAPIARALQPRSGFAAWRAEN